MLPTKKNAKKIQILRSTSVEVYQNVLRRSSSSTTVYLLFILEDEVEVSTKLGLQTCGGMVARYTPLPRLTTCVFVRFIAVIFCTGVDMFTYARQEQGTAEYDWYANEAIGLLSILMRSA